MSFGRALRKIPSRASSRVYHAGRATAEISIVVSAPIVRARPAIPVVSEPDATVATAVRRPTMIAGVTHTNGSRKPRTEWAIILRPSTATDPLVGS